MQQLRVLAADLTYVEGEFRPGIGVEYDVGSGAITRVGDVRAFETGTTQRLPQRALLPGFVNAHSHAFQRLIRGRTQQEPAAGETADFWSWREEMYRAALVLSPDDLYEVARFCYVEMLKAGITSVGEFHYLHRNDAGKAYENPLELHERVLQAAVDVGMRITVLNAAYVMGGFGTPLRWSQRRFSTPTLDAFLRECELLRTRVAPQALTGMGVAPHSVRAVPREWLRPLHDWAVQTDVPLHMHVSEQVAEVEACAAAHGLRPVELLDVEGLISARLTAVHATHTNVHEVALLGRARAGVCACPSTERDLGDGFLPGSSLHAAGVNLSIGTDSQSIIDPFEEVRLIEYHERLRKMQRIVLTRSREKQSVGATLLAIGSENGARALNLPVGILAAGKQADMVAIDLEHMALVGATAASLAAALTLSASAHVLTDVWVGGRQVIEARRHARETEAITGFRQVMSKLE